MSSRVNGTEIRVVGMSRSGNHAIIDWLLAQAPGRTCFLNCAEPTRNPFRWARPLAPDASGWRATYDLDIEAERAGRLSRKDYLVHSYEDVFLGAFRNPLHEARREQFVGASASRIDVLILRDPFNLLASRRASRIGTMAPELAMRVWCQHARQFLGVRRYLAPDAVCVNYNLWASSRAYRRSVSRLLGLEFDDRAAALVPPCAGGSSFNGRRHDGSAARMAVFDRWRRYVGEPDFAGVFSSQVLELAHAIFGELEPARTLPATHRLAA